MRQPRQLTNWMATLTLVQKEWLQRTAKELEVNGSFIVRELINKAMLGKTFDLKEDIREAKLTAYLQEKNDARLLAEEEYQRALAQTKTKTRNGSTPSLV